MHDTAVVVACDANYLPYAATPALAMAARPGRDFDVLIGGPDPLELPQSLRDAGIGHVAASDPTLREALPLDARRSLATYMELFLGSGLLDTGVTLLSRRYFQTAGDGENLQALSSVHIFATAASAGVLLLAYRLYRRKSTLSLRNLLGGIVLGVPNYFSIYLFLKLLSDGPFQPSVAVPVTNISIVVTSVLAGVLLFREAAGTRKWLGLFLAVGAILLLSYVNLFA